MTYNEGQLHSTLIANVPVQRFEHPRLIFLRVLYLLIEKKMTKYYIRKRVVLILSAMHTYLVTSYLCIVKT